MPLKFNNINDRKIIHGLARDRLTQIPARSRRGFVRNGVFHNIGINPGLELIPFEATQNLFRTFEEHIRTRTSSFYFKSKNVATKKKKASRRKSGGGFGGAGSCARPDQWDNYLGTQTPHILFTSCMTNEKRAVAFCAVRVSYTHIYIRIRIRWCVCVCARTYFHDTKN